MGSILEYLIIPIPYWLPPKPCSRIHAIHALTPDRKSNSALMAKFPFNEISLDLRASESEQRAGEFFEIALAQLGSAT